MQGNPQAGDEVSVAERNGEVFGRGYFNPHSMYRVRLLATKGDKFFESSTSEIIYARLQQAMDLRTALLLPRGDTDVFRLVNGEGDGLSGLMVDVLGPTVVIQSSAYWVEKNRKLIEDAVRGVKELAGKEVLWKHSIDRLKKDGWEVIQALGANNEGEGGAQLSADVMMPSNMGGNSDGTGLSTVTENGVRYLLCVEKGQKTGFYCDQRENRQLLRSVARGKSVLDLYCYSGGFTLNAVLGGAKSVTSVDSSLRAVQSLRENIRTNALQCDVCVEGLGPNATTPSLNIPPLGNEDINSTAGVESSSTSSAETVVAAASAAAAEGVSGGAPSFADSSRGAGCSVRLIKGDAQGVMRTLLEDGQSFDVVVCDPPKLAPKRTGLEAATRKYRDINALAMRLVAPYGGLLLSCSCSAAMTQSGQFVPMLHAAARSVGRTATVVTVSGAAGDHPVNPVYPEGRYLTAVLLYIK